MILLIIGVGMLNFLLPAPLNSIMFLLIPERIYHVNAVFLTLNSIMFLLIQISKKEQKNNKHIFKFHYVSINSGLKRTGCCGCPFFKFHYVSINS